MWYNYLAIFNSSYNVEQLESTAITIFVFISGTSFFGVIFISIATVALIIRSLCSTQLNGGVRKFYRQALKATLPFLLLQVCLFLYGLVLLVLEVMLLGPIATGTSYDIKLLRMLIIFYLLYPCSLVLLPLLLLCQPRVTRNLKCMRGGRGGGREDEDRLETAPTSRWSTAVSSRTQFIVPPESFLTEQDPLVIRQETNTVV